MPNLISHEEVIQKQPGRKPTRQRFDYLILSHRAQDAVTLEEYRVDLNSSLPVRSDASERGAVATSSSETAWSDLRHQSDEASARIAGAPPLSQGFAYMWVHFYPSNRSESAFRYLGRQNIDRHNTYVVAFAQKPGAVRLPGELWFHERLIPILYQGVAWIDQADFRIVRLRTDLLSPIAGAELQRLTADIRFEETQVAGAASALWVPRDVIVTSDIQGRIFQDRHLYADYRLYGVQTKIVVPPF